MTDATEITATSPLSPGDVLDVPLLGENVTSIASSIQDDDLNYLGSSVFDVRSMAPLSPNSIVSYFPDPN